MSTQEQPNQAREARRTYDLSALPPKEVGRLRGEIRRIKADACQLASQEQCSTEELDLEEIAELGQSLVSRLEHLREITRKLVGRRMVEV